MKAAAAKAGPAAAWAASVAAAVATSARKKEKRPQRPDQSTVEQRLGTRAGNQQSFVKTIEPTGKEINATRKAPTIALANLLPTFPDTEVRPGSTWETRMTFLGDLSSREPVNVSVPIT